jgi:hypothetical protein
MNGTDHLINFKRDLANSEAIDGNLWTRLFWQPNVDDGNGFKFVCFNVTSMESTNADPTCVRDPFASESEIETCETEVLVWGHGLFDGVRHLYFGHDENFGYHYYPNIRVLILILQKLQELELKYCNPKEINPI